MPPKSFRGNIAGRGNTPKPISDAENIANVMYGGEVNEGALDAFFDAIAENEGGRNAPLRVLQSDTGAIDIGNFRVLATGLQIADGVDVEEWQAFGQHIRMMETSIQWIIGDWLAYGERVYGKTYQEVAELTGYTYETLRNLVWVVRQFDLSSRNDKLSFGHHQTALALCDGNGKVAFDWLQSASDNGWSIKKMADEIKGVPPALPPVKGRMAKFWANFELFSKKNVQIASRAGEAERRQMADALRKLADDLERRK
ncbi:MAG: hypothetical protein SFZ02_19850 [bacterium]|nr:hypothetical protein [bacterium]